MVGCGLICWLETKKLRIKTLFTKQYWHLEFIFGSFLYVKKPARQGQKSLKKIFVILVETMTPKGHFEINWPLCYKNYVTEKRTYVKTLSIGLMPSLLTIFLSLPLNYLL